MILLLSAWLAHADVIFPYAGECPPGARVARTHGDTWCAPDVCPAEGCTDGKSCAKAGLCVSRTTVMCGGRRAPSPEPCTVEKVEAHGACASQADCAEGTCEVADRCVAPGATAPTGGITPGETPSVPGDPATPPPGGDAPAAPAPTGPSSGAAPTGSASGAPANGPSSLDPAASARCANGPGLAASAGALLLLGLAIPRRRR